MIAAQARPRPATSGARTGGPLGGYMGKLLWVDLGSGGMVEEPLDPQLCRQYIGGYGLGVRLLYDKIPRGADPLGPENVLGILTGPLTGTPAIEGNRSVAVCKSPLTGGWGDANCGGTFGPHLKFAGFDGVFFTGQSATPVYLVVEDGLASLHAADDLWGLTTRETEQTLKERHGKGAQVASIGPAGERLARIACIINDEGRAWGRSGVGAVMGSKRLKAIVVKGSAAVPIADPGQAGALRRSYIQRKAGDYDLFHNYGTLGITGESSMSGDSPVKNWSGSGTVDFPTGRTKFKDDVVIGWQDKRYGCWKCTIACGGLMSTRPEDAPYQGVKTHKVEYETAASFGSMLLDDYFPALIRENEICNDYGLDTISAGVTLAFAVECFSRGILTLEDTGGIDLAWRDHEGHVQMLEMIARREGLGDILADGTMRAAERIGKGAARFAMHIGGQEVPMHDPKLDPGLATTYKMDATPARHTQGGAYWFPVGVTLPDGYDKYAYGEHGALHKWASNWMHVLNAAGVCQFAQGSYPYQFIPEFLSAVTGETYTEESLSEIGERIANLRVAFCIREGDIPAHRAVPGRIVGDPPLTEGNVRGVTVDLDQDVRAYCAAMRWDPETGLPDPARLRELDLAFVLPDLTGAARSTAATGA